MKSVCGRKTGRTNDPNYRTPHCANYHPGEAEPRTRLPLPATSPPLRCSGGEAGLPVPCCPRPLRARAAFPTTLSCPLPVRPPAFLPLGSCTHTHTHLDITSARTVNLLLPPFSPPSGEMPCPHTLSAPIPFPLYTEGPMRRNVSWLPLS